MLPVLDGDRLVARVDLAMDRKRNTLVALAVHAEPKVPRGKRLPTGDPRASSSGSPPGAAPTRLEVREAPAAWRPVLAA